MAVSRHDAEDRGLSISIGDVTGALGDSITVLPLVVALGALTPASLPHLLLGFAVFQAVWGVRYGLPLSVEPMKALAGLAVAGSLAYGELVAAGLLAGGLLLVVGLTGSLARVDRWLAEPVVRGVQLSVAATLALAGLDLATGDPVLAVVGLLVAGAATLGHRRAGVLAVLAVGTAVALTRTGPPAVAVPTVAPFPNGGPTVTAGALEAMGAQLAMTVGNAAVATSLLLSDLYDADVGPDELAESMGVTNLLAVPFGALPMCHGSGGLAGKHAFGARTGGANLVLAVLYGGATLVAGLWTGFPLAMLGVLLISVAWRLGIVALDTSTRPLVVGMAALAVVTNVGVAFLAGVLAHATLARLR